MTLKLNYAGFNYVADIDGSYSSADSLNPMITLTGSNSVALTDDYGINAATSMVYADYTVGSVTGNTETLPTLTATIKEAEAKGLTVLVRPLIDFTADASQATLKSSNGNQYADTEWRAYYQPTNTAAFFTSYDTMIVNEAAAAQAGGAQLFDIGTEIDQLTGTAYLNDWTKIIKDVRAVFTGKITYSAISDDDLSPWQYASLSLPNVKTSPPAGTGNIETQVSFWSLLDYVGIDEYAALSNLDADNGGPDPTVAQLVAAWETPFTDDGTGSNTDATADETGGLSLIQYYEKVAADLKKPLLFTEIGYNSAPDAATQPFYTSSGTYDPTLQANLYQAFIQAWQDQGNTSLQGVYLWNWEPNPTTVGAPVAGTTTYDPSWTPQGNAGSLTVLDKAFTADGVNTPSPGTTNPDVYTWTATAGGLWGGTANWNDVTTGANPALIAPGANNAVTIAARTGAAQVITGAGNAASLATTGSLTFGGTFTVGTLAIGTAASVSAVTSTLALAAASATVVYGELDAVGAAITVGGALALGGAAATSANDYQTLSATLGGSVLTGSLVLGKSNNYYTNAYVQVDATSRIVVGAALGSAALGALTVSAGATMSGPGTVVGNVNVLGTLAVQGGLYILGALNTTGSTQIGAGATLDARAVTGSVAFTGPAATLALHPADPANRGAPLLLSATGFTLGDTIDLGGVSVNKASYQVTGTNTGSLSLYNGATALGSITLAGNFTGDRFAITPDGNGGNDVSLVPVALDDFNGDGKSDLLLQNDNGAIVLETTNGLSVAGGGLINSPGPTWHVVGSADFNGDGQTDILLQNDNGAIVDYLMNGTSIAAGNFLTNPGSSWHVRGTGDFNADGNADIVLQNDNGNIIIEYTNGANIIGGATVGNPGANWTVEGVADFNGDGQPDLLLQNTDGTIVDYLMNGATPAAGFQLLGPNAGYSIAGTGNYNGDNRADIVVHNDNGTDVILDTNGQAVIGSSSPIGNPGANWNNVVAGLDFNGDGASDLLIENTGGTIVGYTLNASGAQTAGATLTTPGAGWRATGGPPIQFIDGTGAAPSLAGTPGIDEFNFTSFTAGIHTITNFDAASDLIALSAATVVSYANVQSHEIAYNGGTAIGLTANAAIVIQGVTPSQLSSANFVLR